MPDEIISTDSVVGAAIAWGIETMPFDIGFTRTLEEVKAKRRAIIYRAAGLLAASFRRNQQPSETILEIDETELQDNLFKEADLQRQIANRELTDPEDAYVASPFVVVNPR